MGILFSMALERKADTSSKDDDCLTHADQLPVTAATHDRIHDLLYRDSVQCCDVCVRLGHICNSNYMHISDDACASDGTLMHVK